MNSQARDGEHLELENTVDPSLLAKMDGCKPVLQWYNIGMSEFVDDTAFMAEEKEYPKKKWLSLSLKMLSSSTTLPSKRLRLETALQLIQSTNSSSESRFDFTCSEVSYDDCPSSLYHGTQEKTMTVLIRTFKVSLFHATCFIRIARVLMFSLNRPAMGSSCYVMLECQVCL